MSVLDKWLCLPWKNWSQNVKSVFLTGIDCCFLKGSASVTGFYFVVPKQKCSHTLKQDNVLAFPPWFRMKGNVRTSVFQWGGAHSLPGGEDESQGCAASASITFDPAQLFQGMWK